VDKIYHQYRVLAVDPGPHTGIIWGYLNNKDSSLEIKDHRTAFVEDRDITRYADQLDYWLSRSDILIYEGIHTVRIPPPELEFTYRLTGYLEVAGLRWLGAEHVFQQPPSIKGPHQELAKQLLREGTVHERDALTHILAFRLKHAGWAPEIRIEW
jgi:hypothetical protein